ncbi:hypothetical protein HYPBUDRAFT_103529 [Hyphopichia burtonii NRRL Y-1933]|uniref:Histone deacetylase n=1 Tax=Hyphopichia burtonii NRRL Y-1933 TaxID=984485 RepID=A0A1E4RSQ5_9ASCO|nr:hypothetical protein HYPBUDRAFT_103529 [Hyphopichia burtonii NRRL Y-1933]ODV70290.1 hypothetical protein HYPBUDRAFT_103529 [Hyphopichia burtonii NRRL Y-1933]
MSSNGDVKDVLSDNAEIEKNNNTEKPSRSDTPENPAQTQDMEVDSKVNGESKDSSGLEEEIKLEAETIGGNEESNGQHDGPSVKRQKVEDNQLKSENSIIHKKHNIIVVPPTKPQLFYSPLKTGLVYDVRMRYHAKIFTSYFEYIDPHPEDPRRIYRIYKRLAEAGLIQDTSLSGAEDIGPLMVKIPIREATSEEILEVHSEDHLNYIESTESMSREQLLEETEKGDSIYVNNDSLLLAKLSCGGTIEACKAVIEGKVKNSMAIVRPPGHHAEPDTPGGFCLFSNVAVAAKNCLKSYPESVRKIVIVDWDIHHGNGTQKSFYNDPRVLYISLHRYENGKFYPGTKYGCHTNSGEGPGEGFSVNIPWRNSGMTDSDYIYAFRKVVIPIICEFDPDLIIVSSGFDAADGDIIGGCHVTPAGYGHMTHMLKAIAKGKLSVILEGGYNLDSISKSALGVAKVLVGEPPEKTISSQPQLETLEVIDEVIKFQAKYWKSMKPGNPSNTFDDAYDLPTNSNTPAFKLSNIADPIRGNQVNELFNKYSFISLPILDSSDDKHATFSIDLPPHLDELVVASPDIYDCNTIILSIHDPPEVWANVNPINGNIEGSSSVVLEHPFTQVIEKINQETANSSDPPSGKIGYIDINIPSFALAFPSFNSNQDSNGKQGSSGNDSSSNSNYNPIIFSQELLLYIWDNYISYFSQLNKLVFIGYGDSYQSIVHLYAKRPSQEIKDLVKGTVAFVNRSTLKALVPVMDESMVDWYYRNSVVFTSCLNPCWAGNASGSSRYANGLSESNDDAAKKPRRKFGRVLKASVDGLWDVVSERFDEGVDFILDSIEDFSSSDASN